MTHLPPEPLDVKQSLQQALAHRGIVAAFGVRGSIGLGVLWSDCGLKQLLEPLGMKWNGFQQLCGDFSFLIIDWLEGKAGWNNTCQTLLSEATRRLANGKEPS